MNFDLLAASPFAMDKSEKTKLLLQELDHLTLHHLDKCIPYKSLFHNLPLSPPPYKTLEEIPYLPVSLFKRGEWTSISTGEVYKKLFSSGTTSSKPSQILLNRETAERQSRVLTAILADFIGAERSPLLIVDNEKSLAQARTLNAAGAAMLGLMRFGRDPLFILDEEGNVKENSLLEWLEKYENERLLIVGSTFKVWEAFLKSPEKPLYSFNNAIIVHGGGWKRLQEVAVSNRDFKNMAHQKYGIKQCTNFYGFAEQVGSVFVECEKGVFHAPSTSHIIIRDPISGDAVERGVRGVLQSLSVIPTSYPGHSLLTEDEAFWEDDDRCPCGRKGRTFHVVGRVPHAEPRGCSDVRL